MSTKLMYTIEKYLKINIITISLALISIGLFLLKWSEEKITQNKYERRAAQL